jgi:DNA integrity scanning protein DisA with diadenylate cyclase activity
VNALASPEVGKYINELPKVKGAGIILDDNSERIYKVRIRPRQSWHAGSSPVAV